MGNLKPIVCAVNRINCKLSLWLLHFLSIVGLNYCKCPYLIDRLIGSAFLWKHCENALCGHYVSIGFRQKAHRWRDDVDSRKIIFPGLLNSGENFPQLKLRSFSLRWRWKAHFVAIWPDFRFPISLCSFARFADCHT